MAIHDTTIAKDEASIIARPEILTTVKDDISTSTNDDASTITKDETLTTFQHEPSQTANDDALTTIPPPPLAAPDLQYIQYDPSKEEQYLPLIRSLISKDLSEPYSIYVYRYFLYQWGDLCYMVLPPSPPPLSPSPIYKSTFTDANPEGTVPRKQFNSNHNMQTGAAPLRHLPRLHSHAGNLLAFSGPRYSNTPSPSRHRRHDATGCR